MVDSGATSTVMPKKVADQLGLKYEPFQKKVTQLDGSSVNTIGVAKDTSLILHASPNFSILLDIYIIDLPALFSICLSREFTA
ncbi:retropepsin-like aspartic protease, partial [[Clostridium] innocuum]|uniref:retropepsin-like aspartic protease n=1 Tax=Clostridium innocuum TaxID=1522 RepID=UPI0018CD41DC